MEGEVLCRKSWVMSGFILSQLFTSPLCSTSALKKCIHNLTPNGGGGAKHTLHEVHNLLRYASKSH